MIGTQEYLTSPLDQARAALYEMQGYGHTELEALAPVVETTEMVMALALQFPTISEEELIEKSVRWLSGDESRRPLVEAKVAVARSLQSRGLLIEDAALVALEVDNNFVRPRK